MKPILCFVLILGIVICAKLQHKILPKPSNTLAEANHFYSDTQHSTTYNVEKIKPNIPVVVIMKPSKDQLTIQRTIQFTLKSNTKSTTCKFTSFNNVCVLQDVTSQKLSMDIKCEKLPCQASWVIYQSNSTKAKEQQNLEDLFEIQAYDKHLIVMMFCNNPEVTNLQQALKVYANGQYISTFSNGIRYLLFNKIQNGFIYIKSTADIKACTKMSIYKSNSILKDDQLVKDFITKQKTVYKIDSIPKDSFRLDSAIHALEQQRSIRDDLIIALTGQKDGKRQIIQNSTIHPLPVRSFDFSYIFFKVQESYKNLQIQFSSSDKMIMLNTRLQITSTQLIDKNQLSFFSLKKGQKISYQLIAEQNQNSKEIGYIQLSDAQKLKSDKTQCSVKEGCNFIIEAIDDVIFGNIFISNTKDAKSRRQRVQAEYDINKQATKKINEGDIHYFKKIIPKKSYVQVVVNSPNVILYASNHAKCPRPNQQCYEKIGNNHHPFIYEAKQQTTLMIAVRGLDPSQYTLTIISDDSEYVQLQDSVAFSYLMDDKEDEVVFKFTIPSMQHDVSFNLISPLHSTIMMVSNTDEVPIGQSNEQLSMDGYILFQKKHIKKKTFYIAVVKNDQLTDKYVHFTIIASTKSTNMRLQSGISHYQTISPGLSRQFVFEFDQKQEYILNFYTHNVKLQQVQLKLHVSNKNNNWDDQSVYKFIIDQQADQLDLKDVSEDLCVQEGASTCQIFVKIINSMPVQIDLTLTLMVQHSVIQLKDGLWQSFTANQVSTSSHFYFFPRHRDTSTSIMYKCTFSDLRISYAIWKAQDKTINPVQWPFPSSVMNFKQQGSQFGYRPVKHISIAKQAYEQCWPSCVILISLVQDISSNRNLPNIANLQNFSILISNDLIQIPQNSKIDITLEREEEKFFLLDLKYALEKNQITIFSEATLGYPQIYASIYTDSNHKCPTQNQFDFLLARLQTQISIQTIKKKLRQNNMEGERSLYLCLMATSYEETKFYLEWTAQQQLIKQLQMDSFETVKLQPPNSLSKTFQVLPRNEQYQIKFMRNRGFPIIKIGNCKYNQESGYQQCLKKLQKSQKKKQMVTKTQLFAQQPCQKCIIFIIIQSQQPAQLEIHIQGKNTEVQLKQNIVQSDFTEKDDINRYIITSISTEETIINLHIIEGAVQVDVTDLEGVNIKKQTATNGQIHIIIPPVTQESVNTPQQKQEKSELQNIQKQLGVLFPTILGKSFHNPFGLHSSLRTLHVTVKSQNPQVSSSYTILFSSGQRQIFLQDGLFTQYTLQPKVKTYFYYHNINKKSHAYLTISMPQSAALFNLGMKMYYYTNPEDVASQVQFTPSKPPMRRKTPNPVMMFNLPQDHELYSIVLQNPSQSVQKVTMLINHLQVILLPYNYQFPFILHSNQNLNFLVDVINPGYLQVDVRKCDESTPTFGYTFDQQSFQKEEFSYETSLTDDPNFQYNVKAQNPGTFFMNIKASQGESSIMSMKVMFNPQKIKGSKIKPGNRGVLEYQLLNSQQAQITFTGAVCGGTCPQDLTYYTLSDVSMKDLYGQTVCPASFFNINEHQTMKPLQISQITSKVDKQNKITFTYKLLDHISYISVKGVANTGEQIFYRPIQIVTLWGQLSRTSHTHKLGMLLLALFGLCTLMILVRRNARKGYKPLNQDE